MVKAAFFDMDGVIADTNPYHTEAFKVFFDRYGVRYTDSELKTHMYGKHNSYIMRYFFKRPVEGEEFLAFEREKEGLFREIYAKKAKPLSGLQRFLDELKSQQIHIGLATSAPRANMDLIIDTLNLRSYFEVILTGDDVTKFKPDPQIYLACASQIGATPNACVVFEDSDAGIRAGLAANMHVVGVLTSHASKELPLCSAYIDDFENLNGDWLQQLKSKPVTSNF